MPTGVITKRNSKQVAQLLLHIPGAACCLGNAVWETRTSCSHARHAQARSAWLVQYCHKSKERQSFNVVPAPYERAQSRRTQRKKHAELPWQRALLGACMQPQIHSEMDNTLRVACGATLRCYTNSNTPPRVHKLQDATSARHHPANRPGIHNESSTRLSCTPD